MFHLSFDPRKTLTAPLVLTGALIACGAMSVQAQEYPAKEVRAICSYAAGSGADILVRYYSDKIAKLTGKPVIVENRAGAQGIIGTEYAARAKPDGYTVLFAPVSAALAAAPFLFKKLPYDPLKDFAPVAPISSLNFVFAVDAQSPIKTLKDLIAEMKKKPDNGSYGIANSTAQVAGEVFKEMAGLKSVLVPYTTTAPSVTDMLGGRLDYVVADATFMTGQARAGRVRILAVTGPKRSDAIPDAPTVAESGFAGFEVTAWWGVVVPAGTPKPIIDKLAGLIAQINAMDETGKFLRNVSTDVLNGTPEAMMAMIKQDNERWARYTKLAKIEPQ